MTTTLRELFVNANRTRDRHGNLAPDVDRRAYRRAERAMLGVSRARLWHVVDGRRVLVEVDVK